MRFQRISRARGCPVCKYAEVHRVKRAGFVVKVVCRILNLRSHWCPECDTFFLGPKQLKSSRTKEERELPRRNEEKGAYQPQTDSQSH
jgi:ssDNA-binding Zn-finger/Zn-ribbon topoisomerase 1